MSQIPDSPVREGSRWRFHKPSSEEVAEWFNTVPLDEGMEHKDFVSGVVIIPATEKVKVQAERNGVVGTAEQHQLTFTPYVRVDTRISYFRKLAELREQIAVIEPVEVPRITEGETSNANLPAGFWWHVVKGDGQSFVRYLCCTMRVALYDKERWVVPAKDDEPTARPLREGVATKQVLSPTSDPNALAKAETGAVGRALGMAGILIVGTGIATAEDLAELREQAVAVELPESAQAPETPEQLSERLLGLQAALNAEFPDIWTEVAAWWQERQKSEGWSKIEDAPVEVRRGMATRMQRRLEEARADRDSSPDLPDPGDPAPGAIANRESQK